MISNPEFPRPVIKGFTLVELLVVIAIIGVLVALLLPAVQAARESARRTQCTNQLKQMALGALNHESSLGYLPAGGWGFKWTPDPDMGYGEKQPGGWPFSLLSFLEQGNVQTIGKGLSTTDKKAELMRLKTTVIPMFYCPSRRAPTLGPLAANEEINSDPPPNYLVAKTDYAGSGGCGIPQATTIDRVGRPAGPGRVQCVTHYPHPGLCLGLVDRETASKFDGAIVPRWPVELREISDGTSNTMLFSEAYMHVSTYDSEIPIPNNNNSMYQGYDRDTVRSSSGWVSPFFDPNKPYLERPGMPLPDTDGDPSGTLDRFGSAHPGVFMAALCDGSVQTLTYDIDPDEWGRLGARNDEGGRCQGELWLDSL